MMNPQIREFLDQAKINWEQYRSDSLFDDLIFDLALLLSELAGDHFDMENDDEAISDAEFDRFSDTEYFGEAHELLEAEGIDPDAPATDEPIHRAH